MTHRIFVFLFVLSATQWLAFAQRAAGIAHTLQSLRDVKIEDEMGHDVPQQAIPLLSELKHQLLEEFEEVLKDADPQATPGAIRRKLLQRLKDAGIQNLEASFSGAYGGISIEISHPQGHPELLVIVDTFSLPCGEDSSLYVFERQKNAWHFSIAIEANGYKQVSDALGHLQYRISPVDGQGRWFLFYMHDYPRCISAWNGIEFAAVRPGTSGHKSRVIVKGREATFEEDEPKLQVGRAGDRLEFQAGRLSEEGGPFPWPAVIRYRIDCDRATRISPLAFSPEGFLIEWAKTPWPNAARWSKASLVTTRRWHEMLHNPKFDFDIKSVQPSLNKHEWQIVLNLEPLQEGSPEKSQALLITVIKTSENYSISRITRVRPGETSKPEPPE
jgi:hypothetical protein